MANIRTGIFGVIAGLMFAVVSAHGAFAQNLDLASLASFDYVGKDASDNKTACSLNVSEIGRDFSGRFFQDYRAWVNGRSNLNFNIRLKGPERYRSPEALSGNTAQYSIPMDIYVLVLLTNADDPSKVVEYRLHEGTVVGTSPRIRCLGVKSQPR